MWRCCQFSARALPSSRVDDFATLMRAPDAASYFLQDMSHGDVVGRTVKVDRLVVGVKRDQGTAAVFDVGQGNAKRLGVSTQRARQRLVQQSVESGREGIALARAAEDWEGARAEPVDEHERTDVGVKQRHERAKRGAEAERTKDAVTVGPGHSVEGLFLVQQKSSA